MDTWIDEKNRRVWKFLEGRYSIMSNEGEDIKEEWIDRETYQKTFWILSQQRPALPSAYELYGESILYFSDRKSKQSSVKAVVSGFYSEKRDSFIVPKITVNKTNLNTSSFPEKIGDKKIPLVAFQLTEDGKVLQEVKRPALPMNFKTLYHNGAVQTEPFDFSHTMAVFPLPADREKRNLQVWILGPKGNKVYSAFLPKTTIKTVDIRNFVD
ncbi:MAG: hypothetical protein OXJ52_07740 [Oligoflexia bacterium]|nr:hypothetical protein [Oligoflexia bacterium]